LSTGAEQRQRRRSNIAQKQDFFLIAALLRINDIYYDIFANCKKMTLDINKSMQFHDAYASFDQDFVARFQNIPRSNVQSPMESIDNLRSSCG